MTVINKNKDVFPLDGILGKIVKAIIPQKNPNLDPELVHYAPSQTFTGLIKSILKEKHVKWFLISGYFSMKELIKGASIKRATAIGAAILSVPFVIEWMKDIDPGVLRE